MKHFFVLALAAVGAYAIWEWYQKNPNSPGGPNPVVNEVQGYQSDTNFSSSSQMTSGIPLFNGAPIANGHGDQVAAAYHSNRYSTLDGNANYEPAFGPDANR